MINVNVVNDKSSRLSLHVSVNISIKVINISRNDFISVLSPIPII